MSIFFIHFSFGFLNIIFLAIICPFNCKKKKVLLCTGAEKINGLYMYVCMYVCNTYIYRVEEEQPPGEGLSQAHAALYLLQSAAPV
jgi:hypothetical protein